MKIKVLIPLYNDWQSLLKLLENINHVISDMDHIISIVVVNDGSTEKIPNRFSSYSKINSIKIINLKENVGHARSIATGLKFILENDDFDYIIPMDSDGEDRPDEIKELIKKIDPQSNLPIVCERVKRSEGFFFKFLYQMHKIITYIFTGKNINFGNYSCLTKKDAEQISIKASLWSSYSGTVKKYIKDLNEIKSTRGIRYFGPSKMSLFNLILHSFSIIAVFKYNVFFRSIIFLFILDYLSRALNVNLIFIQILLILFCIIIFAVSLREKEEELQNSQENLKSVNLITH